MLYYSRNGSTAELARHVCRGVEVGRRGCRAAAHRAARSSRRKRGAPRGRCPPRAALRDARGSARGRCADARQPDPLRQHGRAAQVFYRLDLELCGSTGALAGKPAARVHRDADHARRPGEHAAVDDAAAPASRHVPRRTALHRARAARNAAAAAPPMAPRTSPAAHGRHADRGGARRWRRRSAGAWRELAVTLGTAGSAAPSTSRMNGTVRRRCACSAASSIVSSSSYSRSHDRAGTAAADTARSPPAAPARARARAAAAPRAARSHRAPAAAAAWRRQSASRDPAAPSRCSAGGAALAATSSAAALLDFAVAAANSLLPVAAARPPRRSSSAQACSCCQPSSTPSPGPQLRQRQVSACAPRAAAAAQSPAAGASCRPRRAAQPVHAAALPRARAPAAAPPLRFAPGHEAVEHRALGQPHRQGQRRMRLTVSTRRATPPARAA